MFMSTLGKGFQLSFDNGLTASVQWGPGNYCGNSGDYVEAAGHMLMIDATSEDAEVAVWYTNSGRWLKAPDFIQCDSCFEDEVVGYLSADEVVDFLSAVKNYRPE